MKASLQMFAEAIPEVFGAWHPTVIPETRDHNERWFVLIYNLISFTS